MAKAVAKIMGGMLRSEQTVDIKTPGCHEQRRFEALRSRDGICSHRVKLLASIVRTAMAKEKTSTVIASHGREG
ncbi:MAG TPA: hypothetical protein VIM00_02905 [Candidatus Acidoferrum sp.]